MKATELRLGNLINTKNPNMNPFKIEAIEREKAGGYNNFGSFVYWYCNDFEPIPLTEEWLLKFGFAHKFDNIYTYPFRISDNLVVEMKFEGWAENISLFTNGFFSSNSVKYVHQLQNLYFSLTGQELTIKETS